MKYEITQDRLDKIIFRYLDMYYGDLEKFNGRYSDIVFKKPNLDSEYGIMGWRRESKLYIYTKLMDELSNIFSLGPVDSMRVIGRWIENRYQVEVNTIDSTVWNDVYWLKIKPT